MKISVTFLAAALACVATVQGLATPKAQKRGGKHKQITIAKAKTTSTKKVKTVPAAAAVATAASSNTWRSIGYFMDLWTCAQYKMQTPSDIPAGLYTHLIYSFVSINAATLAYDFSGLNFFSQFIALKQKDPSMKLMVSLGGADAAVNWPAIYAKPAAFAQATVQTLRAKGVQGIDIDWEYPNAGADRTGLVAIAKALNAAFVADAKKTGLPRLLLSFALPGSAYNAAGYDVTALSAYADFFNIMSYDEHGSWDISAGAACATNLIDTTNEGSDIENGLPGLLKLYPTVPKSKFNLGLNFEGNTYTLKAGYTPIASSTGLKNYGSVSGVGGNTGCFDWPGIIVYYDAVAAVKKGAATKLDSTAQCWYTEYTNGQIGVFDDPQTIAAKVAWGKQYGLGGAFAWAIYADSQTYGLSKAMAGQAHTNEIQTLLTARGVSKSAASTTPVPTKSTADAPMWGQCGPDNGGLKCPGTQCCSSYGWCGVSTDYCGANCLSGFGSCASTSSKRAATVTSAKTKKAKTASSKTTTKTKTAKTSKKSTKTTRSSKKTKIGKKST